MERQERSHRKPNYCTICNRQLSDADAFKSHTSNNAHKAKLASYTQNPTPIITAYSNRFSSDMLDLIQGITRAKGKNTSVRLEEVYKEYVKTGRKGGIVYIEATKWENLDMFGRRLHENGLGEWEEGTGAVRCNRGIDEVIKAEHKTTVIKKRKIDTPKGKEDMKIERKASAPLVKQEVGKAVHKKVTVNPLFQEERIEDKGSVERPSIKQPPRSREENETSEEEVVGTVTEELIDDVPSTAVEEEVPWIRPGLLVTLTGLEGTYPSLDNSRALITDVQDSFGALVSPLSSSAPLLLVDQDNCIPIVDLEDLGPFGATEPHQIIKGNEDDVGKMVQIIRRMDKYTVECVDECGTRIALPIDSLCLTSRHK